MIILLHILPKDGDPGAEFGRRGREKKLKADENSSAQCAANP